MNLLIGTVLFVVVMIVLITNSQRVSDLKKSIKNSAVDTSVSSNQSSMFVRDKEGIYAPKRAYYVSPTTAANANSPPDKADTDVDQLILPFDGFAQAGAMQLASDIQEGRCKVLYRPETRILYKITSFMIHTGSSWLTSATELNDSYTGSTFNVSTPGTLLVNLKRNMESITSDITMFTEAEKTSGNMRTIIGVPCEMSGNMASGI